MRDINECTAEVFRRSKEIIAKRNRRRRTAIAVCTPLCLCAVILTATVFPSLRQKKADSSNLWGGTFYTEAEISCEGGNKKITDKADIDRITNALRALDEDLLGGGNEYVCAEEDGDTEDNGSDQENYVIPDEQLSGLASYGSDPDGMDEATSNTSNTYSISLVGKNGEKTVYTLTGCRLICETDGGTAITLTDEEAESLRQIFEATD